MDKIAGVSTREYEVISIPLLPEALRGAGRLRVFDPRSLAVKLNVTPQEAELKIEKLKQLRLIMPSGLSDQAYRVTTEGYEVIEQLG